MQAWKKSIFVSALKSRIEQENKPAKEIIKEYTKLTNSEKKQILAEIE